jgi:hypothetical protein
MRTFVLYDEEGNIQSVARVEVMPEGAEQPFLINDDGKQKVSEVSDEKLTALDPLELHDNFKMDVESGTPVPKPKEAGEPSQAAPDKRKK